MRFAYVSVVVVFGGLVVLGGVESVAAQDESLGRVARRDPAPADDDFLPLPSTSEQDDESSWWKPTMPKLSMPKIERPKTPAWVKKMNQNTREAVDKTRSAMTAPFQSQSKKQAPKRPIRKDESPGFWSRMFGSEEPQAPTTTSEFLRNARPGFSQ